MGYGFQNRSGMTLAADRGSAAALAVLRQRFISTAMRLRAIASRHKAAIFALAFAIFGTGLIFSLRDLRIGFADLHWRPLAILIFILVPCTIAYSAVNMVLMARAAKVPMRFIDAVRVSAFAQVAEMLPIPGGAIVRTAALKEAGAGLAQSAGLILGFSVLWVVCAAFAAGMAMWDQGWLPQMIAAFGLAAIFVIVAGLARSFNWSIALGALGLRVLGLALVAIRLACSFAIIGTAVSFSGAVLFSFAGVLGSAASLAPGGLGISESLAAFLAGSVAVAPAAAFLAQALNRLVGLALHLLVALGFVLRDRYCGPLEGQAGMQP